MDQSKHTPKLFLGSFHFIKGIAISVIIIGHISELFHIEKVTLFYPLFILLNFLKTPFIPLFFLIAGYGLKPVSLGTQLKKTAKSLLVPYLLTMVAFTTLIPLSVYLRQHNWRATVTTGISIALAFLLGIPIPGKVILGYRLSHCAIIWFLLAAFWGYNILNLVLKQKRIGVQILLVLSCALAGYGLFLLDFTYYCIPHGLIAASYFYIGYLLKQYNLLQRGLPHKWMYAVWVILALLYACWGEFDLCYGLFACFPVDYVGVVFLALLLLVLGIYAGRLEGKLLDIFSSIGVYSYWVLCIHSIEQKCLPWPQFVKMTAAHPNIGFILALILKIMIITAFCKMMKQIQKIRYKRQKKTYDQKKLHPGTD